MSIKPKSSLRSAAAFIWGMVDATRRATFNVLFLLVLIVFVIALSSGGVKPLNEKTALILELKGELVEQHSGNVRDALAASVRGGDGRRSVQLRDVLTVLDAAAKDKKIGSVVVLLDELNGAGMPILREVGAALDRVKAAGKRVVAWGGSYDQRQYLIAVHADEVYLHPMGSVYLKGIGQYRNYYRDALDKLGVTVNLMRVGTYKSFAEPYIGNGPSQAATDADQFLYNAIWASYTGEVEKQRKLPAGAVMREIDDLPKLMDDAGGDPAKVALAAKLVDGLKTRDELRKHMVALGAPDADNKSFRQISFDDYQARQHPKVFGEAIGVVVAEGEIGDGSAGPGAIGGVSTANLIRRAREDAQIKAIVLRVDSPGGSPYGSELIRRELELARQAGKPVVVSMGSVAASGGYWISMAADEVVADPTTITGSIGVFSLVPRVDKVVDKLGIHTAGVTTSWLADAGNPLRPLDPRYGQVIQASINHIYDEFTSKAAAARKLKREAVDAVAQGRVWTGAQAKERGLIDTVGSYGDALASAAKRAKLGADYRVSYIEHEGSRFERLLELFGASSAQALAVQVKLGLAPTGMPASKALEAAREMSWLSDLSENGKPFAAITHCLCTLP
ncbi:MAG: signal peptide peptidase SppA [Pseudomonadota bacterium]